MIATQTAGLFAMPFFGESNPQLALFPLYYRPFPAQNPTLFSSTLLPCQTNCSPAAFSLAILRLLWHVTEKLLHPVTAQDCWAVGVQGSDAVGRPHPSRAARDPPSRGLPARSRCNAETPKVSSEAFRHLAQRLLQSTGLFSGRSNPQRGRQQISLIKRLPASIFP